MTNDKERYTLRMPTKYAELIRAEAAAIGTSMSAIILRIFASHYGFLDEACKPIINEGGNLENENAT